MGTRSLTFVYDGNVPVINIYRQFDGYPSGHGHELAQFLNSKTLVNGYKDKNSAEANGMGCLAAQLIVQLKHGVGGIYIYPVASTDCFQDYEYHVYKNKVDRLLFHSSAKIALVLADPSRKKKRRVNPNLCRFPKAQ